MIETVIDCIDCGGRCHVVQPWPEDQPPAPGDVVAPDEDDQRGRSP